VECKLFSFYDITCIPKSQSKTGINQSIASSNIFENKCKKKVESDCERNNLLFFIIVTKRLA